MAIAVASLTHYVLDSVMAYAEHTVESEVVRKVKECSGNGKYHMLCENEFTRSIIAV